ncbi:hypothetical protein Pcinc_037942 [Petrolisthes cinctipes]|uniref:Uncharacterized protein n=1 Tax=Petrolisthes cinctipes TaxID=88211 RepID=A0AAE1EKI5_PETCI|nr:hypothetical protein Pcinc_037942 [Petrolisthes cinctipes]
MGETSTYASTSSYSTYIAFFTFPFPSSSSIQCYPRLFSILLVVVFTIVIYLPLIIVTVVVFYFSSSSSLFLPLNVILINLSSYTCILMSPSPGQICQPLSPNFPPSSLPHS